MTDAPKLLTRDVLERYAVSPSLEAELHERGLIAPEPEPKLTPEQSLQHIERRLGKLYVQRQCWPGTFDIMDVIRPIFRKAIETATESAPAASPLTRDQLADAIVKVFGEGEHGFGNVTPNNITALHAALTEQVKP